MGNASLVSGVNLTTPQPTGQRPDPALKFGLQNKGYQSYKDRELETRNNVESLEKSLPSGDIKFETERALTELRAALKVAKRDPKAVIIERPHDQEGREHPNEISVRFKPNTLGY